MGGARSEDHRMKILVVEDEPATAAYLSQGLLEEGYAVDVSVDGPAADEAVAVNEYDLIVLDGMLPGIDGFTLCQQWRSQGVVTPVLFLTALDDVRDRVRGLNLGGDDYLVKPFDFDELLARVRALLRRGRAVSSTSMRVGDLEIDLAARTVRRGGRDLGVTAREFQVLEYLCLHGDQVVSRAALWEHVWSTGSEPESNAIDVYVRTLRNKMGRDVTLIETVRGQGYIFRTRETLPDALASGA